MSEVPLYYCAGLLERSITASLLTTMRLPIPLFCRTALNQPQWQPMMAARRTCTILKVGFGLDYRGTSLIRKRSPLGP